MKTVIVELDSKVTQKLNLPDDFKGNVQDIADDLKLKHCKIFEQSEISVNYLGLSAFKEKAKYRFLK